MFQLNRDKTSHVGRYCDGHNSITLKLGYAMETYKDCLNINAYRAEAFVKCKISKISTKSNRQKIDRKQSNYLRMRIANANCDSDSEDFSWSFRCHRACRESRTASCCRSRNCLMNFSARLNASLSVARRGCRQTSYK